MLRQISTYIQAKSPMRLWYFTVHCDTNANIIRDRLLQESMLTNQLLVLIISIITRSPVEYERLDMETLKASHITEM